MPFAEVAVNVPFQRHSPADAAGEWDVRARLGRTFHYAIPAALAATLRAGHLVQVPFGKQEVQGVVVALSDEAPVAQTRYISALMDDAPIMSPAQIALGRWICAYYLTPLFSALQPMLPPGLEQRSRLTATWRGEGALPPDLPAETAQVAALLRDRRQMRSDQLDRYFSASVWRKALDQLSARGLASAMTQLTTPAARVQVEQFARALIQDPKGALLASGLGRQTKESALLSRLLNAPAGVLLLDAGAMTPAKALEGRGLARLDREARSLYLVADHDAARDVLLQLRRLDRYRPALEFLVAEGGMVWVGAVYAETGANAALLRELAEAGLVALTQQERVRDPLAGLTVPADKPLRFTPDQERVWRELAPALEAGRGAGQVFLLHGVTGSGKTEIYLQALERVLHAGRQAIVLVPEIALTPQTIRRFAARFPGRITTVHSQLSEGERYDQWRRMRAGQVDIVIGPRSAIFAPLPRLGLIVVDEEHEDAYKSERMPAYHARQVAIQRAQLEGCPIILGSATPSLESYYQATLGRYRLLELPNRVMGHQRQIEEQCRRLELLPRAAVRPLGEEYGDACLLELPHVELVDLRDELRAGNRSIFSRALQRELQRVLETGEQAILFLNRRGLATNVSCRDCGHVAQCPRCHIPLTYHGANTALVCHHCNQRQPAPVVCPQCGGRRIRYLGSGDEQVEETVRQLFPKARTLRWDRDTTTTKGAHESVMTRFTAREADVLIGTQMIAKGLDLPLVTLVGVVLADTGLYLPDFRAAERTFQVLAQVAGRAGRSALGGSVIIQTYTPEHYSLRAAAGHDFAGFYQEELRRRRELGYPPFSRLARLLYVHKNEGRAQVEAERLAEKLQRHWAQRRQRDAALIGPAPCFFSRLREAYRWQLIVRAPDPAEALAHFALPAGWRLDIDPAALL